MKILGWILTIIGGFLSFGALIQITDSRHSDGFYLPSALTAIAVLVVGLVILNSQKKK
jgi:hypothetical protein